MAPPTPEENANSKPKPKGHTTRSPRRRHRSRRERERVSQQQHSPERLGEGVSTSTRNWREYERQKHMQSLHKISSEPSFMRKEVETHQQKVAQSRVILADSDYSQLLKDRAAEKIHRNNIKEVNHMLDAIGDRHNRFLEINEVDKRMRKTWAKVRAVHVCVFESTVSVWAYQMIPVL